MQTPVAHLALLLGAWLPLAMLCAADDALPPAASPAAYEVRNLAGWTVKVSPKLLAQDAAATARALDLLKVQLDEIVRVVPPPAVAELQKVPLWISPEYPGVPPRAEYHPDARWLGANGRDPAMARGVEFTNVRVFEAEVRRMPNFALHELAHAYHDRVLSFEQPEIKAAYEHAKAAKLYDQVERSFGDGRPNTRERAYALSNHKEYFAELTEAYFARNDFFPFTRAELEKLDPDGAEVLRSAWRVAQ